MTRIPGGFARLIPLLVLCACGSAGLPFTPNSELADQSSLLPDGGVDPRFLEIVIAKIDQGPLDCMDSLDAGITPFLSGPFVAIAIARLDGTPLGVGSYPVIPQDVFQLDAGIGATVALGAITAVGLVPNSLGISGTVNLTTVGSTIEGDFNSEVVDPFTGARSNYAGSFNAPLCVP
jgi:hypothetical protein